MSRTIDHYLMTLNTKEGRRRKPYCSCGRSFDDYERMLDGRCELCHETDEETEEEVFLSNLNDQHPKQNRCRYVG